MLADTTKKVLFISHDASRTGAPLVLLNFLKWFKVNTAIPFLVLLKVDGEMEPDFQELGPTFVLRRRCRSRHFLMRQMGNLWMRFGEIGRLHELKARLVEKRIGLVYSNTIANGNLLRAISHLNCPVITHVHELEQLIQYFGPKNCRLALKYSQRFIAVSQAVKDNLVSRHGAPLESVDVVHSSIPLPANGSKDKQQTRSRILEKLGIPHESLIIGACGSTSRQKGTDLFVRLARVVRERHQGPPIHFIWVGPDTRELRFSGLRQQVDRLGLSDCVHFVGKQARPLDYFVAFDVYAMTSREDALGLVILEAASVGKPIVCFGCAGGAKEFVEEDCGFVIPTLDSS